MARKNEDVNGVILTELEELRRTHKRLLAECESVDKQIKKAEKKLKKYNTNLDDFTNTVTGHWISVEHVLMENRKPSELCGRVDDERYSGRTASSPELKPLKDYFFCRQVTSSDSTYTPTIILSGILLYNFANPDANVDNTITFRVDSKLIFNKTSLVRKENIYYFEDKESLVTPKIELVSDEEVSSIKKYIKSTFGDLI